MPVYTYQCIRIVGIQFKVWLCAIATKRCRVLTLGMS